VGNFYTDTIQTDPRFTQITRCADITLLEPVMRAAVNSLIVGARGAGISLMVFETYRSQQRQQQLFAAGASKLRTVGVHHYGLACDIVFDVGGEPSWKGDFTVLRDLANNHGLVWGGDWGEPGKPHTFRDMDHVQRVDVSDQYNLFRGEWYPDENYNPLALPTIGQ